MDTILKRDHFYLMEGIYTRLIVKLLPYVGKSFLTPNMITSINIINTVVVFLSMWSGKYILAAILVQLYLFLDILDGNLARYQKKSTRIGAILDQISDRLFYNGVIIVLGLKIEINILWILAYLLIHNLYGIIATFYIVPHIRKMNSFRRDRVKQYLMDKGIILGMDLSTQDLITSLLILTPYKEWIIYLSTSLYGIDLIYRLIELNRNINKRVLIKRK
ncbi:MAG TPA: CDP-alcohol phosphatidyltransferase family protein [Halanaerobiales bacterium]|nr:CDP-alcohol phosphatidyltransferase family protein [Halanaerobiales bacterium]HPZ63907.1 CDP-alcohol phosphatidyltransferase family protein [Halanaerobiales bacterium]HQD04032.1 CDP-alcohol phosphatidyltransferase family protein [Halanaerobiales bacterium]